MRSIASCRAGRRGMPCSTLVVAACFAASWSAATLAMEQARGRVIEEILVTGTKREAAAQDVPIAVSAISGETLRQQYRNDILALGELSPGVAIGQQPGFRACSTTSA